MEEKQFETNIFFFTKCGYRVRRFNCNWELIPGIYDWFVFGNRTNIVYEDVPENMVAETEERRKELIGQSGTVSPSLCRTVSSLPFRP